MKNISEDEQCLHFFFDGYSIDEKELANVGKVKLFMDNINKCIFNGNGKLVLIPYFDGKVKEDGGVSGIILGENSHFTCHTFCYKNTVFIDYFGDKSKHNDVKDLIFKYLFSISPVNPSDKVTGLGILYGKCTAQDQLKTAYDKQLDENPINPFVELLPLIEGVNNDAQQNKLDTLFKKLLG